jgi:hypothetical protein
VDGESKQGLVMRDAAPRLAMIGLLLLSAALVWHDLATRDVLGRDENATIAKLDQPDMQAVLLVTGMKITGEPGNMQPLYFLVQHLFWPLVERNVFMLRFLSSAFALLSVAVTYKLGEALFSSRVGLLGALFTALLPLHVRYAQIARPYTLLALLSLASAYFLVRALQIHRPRHWAVFVAFAALSFYTHFNAAFVLVAEGMFTGIVWLTMFIDVVKKRRPARQLLEPILAFLLVGLLCLPALLRLVGMPWVGLSASGESGSTVAVDLTLSFFARFLLEIGLTTVWLRGLILVLMVLGLVAALWRGNWQAALFALLWVATPFVVLAVTRSPRPFEERYVIFVPPVALLLAGQGVVSSGQALGKLGQRWSPGAIRWAVTIAVTAGLALLFVIPLNTYYVANQSEDRLDYTLRVVERHGRPGDIVVVSPRTLIRPLNVSGTQVRYLTEHLSPTELDDLALNHQRMWILYTSFLPAAELQEPLDQWVQAQGEAFVRMPIKAPSTLAYGGVAATDDEISLQDRIAVLEDLAAGPAGRHGKWVRHSVLADAYTALGDLYETWGDSTRASEYWSKAEETRAAAPPPW